MQESLLGEDVDAEVELAEARGARAGRPRCQPTNKGSHVTKHRSSPLHRRPRCQPNPAASGGSGYEASGQLGQDEPASG